MNRALCALATAALSWAAPAHSACDGPASPACYFAFTVGDAARMLRLHYYASRPPGETVPGPAPSAALIALHGHPRDANKTFDAALAAVKRGNVVSETLVVAPVFQVEANEASRCSTTGVPAAQDGDLLWSCSSWLDGSVAQNASTSSFAALDALVVELIRQWPGLRSITIAGFSAGAQLVQHYIGFAALPTAGGGDREGAVALRYVVADPGTWLYFDPITNAGNDCPAAKRWKYGIEGLPPALGRSAAAARDQYAQADISYLAGELDNSAAPGSFYKALDKSCAANAQGPYRLQRAQAYAAYDRDRLAPQKQRQVIVVPGCAHDVACVFTSPAARAALLGPAR